MLNPEFKAKWIAALRSGEYAQTRGYLKNAGGYCCLGVACDVYGNHGWDGDFYRHGENTSSAALPRSLELEIGMPENEGSKLMDLNDCERASFSEIADYIQDNL